jgi:hypothetical protein
MFPEPQGRFFGYDLSAVADLLEKVDAELTIQDPAFREAMVGFDDRDLARFAEEAGFDRIHVECHIDVEPGGFDSPVSLEALLDTAPNPNAPTVREAIHNALTEAERSRFLDALEMAFGVDSAISRHAVAYVVAMRES